MKAVLIQAKTYETSPIHFILYPIENGKLRVSASVVGQRESMLDFAKKRNYEVIEITDRVFVGVCPFEELSWGYTTM